MQLRILLIDSDETRAQALREKLVESGNQAQNRLACELCASARELSLSWSRSPNTARRAATFAILTAIFSKSGKATPASLTPDGTTRESIFGDRIYSAEVRFWKTNPHWPLRSGSKRKSVKSLRCSRGMVSSQRLSQAEQVVSNAWLEADGGCIFADAPNAVTLAAATLRQISMHRNITRLRVTRSSRASSRTSSGFTTIVRKNSSTARNFARLALIR